MNQSKEQNQQQNPFSSLHLPKAISIIITEVKAPDDGDELTEEQKKVMDAHAESQRALHRAFSMTEDYAFDGGFKQGKIEAAKNALKEGLSLEVIGQITKLEQGLILQLKSELADEG